MKRRNMLLGGALVVVCGAVGLGSLNGSQVKSVGFSELPKMKPTERYSVYGKLDTKSIRPIRGANLVRFVLNEEKTNRPLEVVYDNHMVGLPANFPNASHAKVTGSYDPATGQFTGDSVMTKCPSKYESEGLELEQKKAVDKWQKATGLVSQAN